MRILMKRTVAQPDGVYSASKVFDDTDKTNNLTAETAKRFIKDGVAVECDKNGNAVEAKK